jgi:thiamine-phosphate pyrophosphorylase
MSAPDFSKLRLIAITNAATLGMDQTVERAELLAHAAEPGTLGLQLRDHELSSRERLQLGQELCRVARASGQRFIVNDRVDLFCLLGAEGLHLGGWSLTPSQAQRVVHSDGVGVHACHSRPPQATGGGPPPLFWTSRSAHDLAALTADEQPSAWLFSPILAERKARPPLGLTGLREAREQLDQLFARPGLAQRPKLFALGGIGSENAPACLATGADGVAVMAGAWGADALPLLESLGLLRGSALRHTVV